MIKTIEEAISFLHSDQVQKQVIYPFTVCNNVNGKYSISGKGEHGEDLVRIATAEEVIEEANTYKLAFQRRGQMQ